MNQTDGRQSDEVGANVGKQGSHEFAEQFADGSADAHGSKRGGLGKRDVDEGSDDENDDGVAADSCHASHGGFVTKQGQRDEDEFDRDDPGGESQGGDENVCQCLADRADPIGTGDFRNGGIV